MALSDAEKQRRYRRHRAGDHSRCDPARECRAGAESSSPVSASVPVGDVTPPEFGPRGAELWAAMRGVEMGPAHRVLLAEACRLADRLDRFERVLSGGYWFFERMADTAPGESERVEVVIDNVLSEARQHASALKAIVSELEPKPSVSAAAAPALKRASGIADLSARLAARKAAST